MLRLLTAIAIAVVVVGCGGDNGGSSNGNSANAAETYDPEASTTMSTASLTKAQFIKKMNKECREAWVTVIDNWDVYTGTQDPKLGERKRFEEAVPLSFLAGIDFHIFDEFRIVGAPRGEERAIEKIIGPFQIAVELGWKNRWRAHSVAEILPHFEEYNAGAERYGLDDCVLRQSRLEPIETLGST